MNDENHTVALVAALCFSSQAFAEVSLTTGTGYANMAKELAKAFSATSGNKVTENFGGNIGQMMAQIANGNGANVVISDEGTLKSLKTPVSLPTFILRKHAACFHLEERLEPQRRLRSRNG